MIKKKCTACLFEMPENCFHSYKYFMKTKNIYEMKRLPRCMNCVALKIGAKIIIEIVPNYLRQMFEVLGKSKIEITRALVVGNTDELPFLSGGFRDCI